MSTDLTPIPFTPERLVEATGGVLLCNKSDNIFECVSINSHGINKNDLFVAVKGENHDAHDFVTGLVESGIKGFIIDKNKADQFPVKTWGENGITCIAVDNTVKALGDLAHSQRMAAGVKVIAVTGSSGKTSTRSMITSILKQQYLTHATSGNFNNEIGLPLTLLKLSEKHEWAVVELGMNAPGEIARLGKISAPDIGIIINVGNAHLEGLGSIENIAKAKAELLSTINQNGTAIVNCMIPLFSELTMDINTELVIFGNSSGSHLKSSEVELNNGCVSFNIETKESSTKVTLKTPGTFMVENALAAAAAGISAGVGMTKIVTGLESFSPVKGRMNVVETKKGSFVIDDTYNANPDSMKAALSTLKKLKGENKGYFISGDMLELGESTTKLHEEIGSFSAENGIEELYVTGVNAEYVSNGAINSGMKPEYIFTGTKKEIINTISKKLNKNDWVLVKGSRAMAMEEIVEALSEKA